jgi:hypothetical protein
MAGKVFRDKSPGGTARTVGGTAFMSTVTRERAQAPLPQTGRGDVMLAAVALLVCLLALVLKLAGIA